VAVLRERGMGVTVRNAAGTCREMDAALVAVMASSIVFGTIEGRLA
jgi:hypothetical protein